MEFDWDPGKNAANLAEHDIDFVDAKEIFHSSRPYLDREDDREDYGEERRIRLGWVNDLPMVVVYTMRGKVKRLISARMAEQAEEIELAVEVDGEKKLQKGEWHKDMLIKEKKKRLLELIEMKREREQR